MSAVVKVTGFKGQVTNGCLVTVVFTLVHFLKNNDCCRTLYLELERAPQLHLYSGRPVNASACNTHSEYTITWGKTDHVRL